MRKYMVFQGSVYYPNGGAYDFQFAADDLDFAKVKIQDQVKEQICWWWHIYDVETDTIVCSDSSH